MLASTNAGILCWASLAGRAPPVALTLAALAAFLLSGYMVVIWLQRTHSLALMAGYLTLLVAAFVYLKKYTFLDALLPTQLLTHAVPIVGLSYMLFRQIHFLVDVAQGQIERPSLWTYLNYQTNFTTLLAGPIQRYQDFTRDWNDLNPIERSRDDLLATYQRIFIGVIKVTVFASMCTTVYQGSYDALLRVVSPEGGMAASRLFCIRQFLLMLYAYPMFVYFDFSGYCDIVIGVAALLGIRLPENFDRPYVSRNMIDFWTRQHMTLSFWIRDYLFTPMYKAMVSTWPMMTHSAAYICYFVAFLIAGVWHGSTMNFVVFGLLHGAGVSSVKIWERIIIQHSGRQGLKKYLQTRWCRVVATVVTLNFVSFTFIFFTPDLTQKLTVLRGVVRAIALGGTAV